MLYSADFLWSFHVGFVMTHGWRKRIVMYGRSIAKYYFKRGTAFIDLFSVVPFIVQVCSTLEQPAQDLHEMHTPESRQLHAWQQAA